ncbi:amidohydrolase family protein [Parasphingorhabdus sp.]|uniref:Xaa-Pro dipeptidase n=1 Tax=Parasphingorhabdus sp. TaxID=2709688 RepID=UPI003593AF28
MKLKILAVASLLLMSSPSAAETIVIKAAAMVDVEKGVLVANPVIIVTDGTIRSIDTGTAPLPEDSQIIDLGDRIVMPGLIDMHVHLMGKATDQGYRRLVISHERAAITGVMNARTTLMAGFTTVRNVGAPSFSDVALRDAIADGDVPGPRMFVAGPSIGITGGHCSDNNLLPEEFAIVGEGVADGPWAARTKVRRNIKYGVDLIKTCSTGGVLSKGTQVGAPQYTLEELTALTEEAHSHGRRVASHAHGAEGILNALKAGVDTIEHASFISDEGIAMAKRQGTYLSMDIYNTEYILGEGEKAGFLEESLAKERMTGATQRESFRRAHQAGVKMVMGTDAGVYPHGDNARQLSRMVRFGMTPAEALRAATSNAADALGHKGKFGALMAGASADIIAVEGNPLDDVTLLENVSFVMKEGVVYKSE